MAQGPLFNTALSTGLQYAGYSYPLTGRAGFIGLNLANSLAEENEVIALDNGYLVTPKNLDEGVEYVDASVLDEGPPTEVDVVFHFAALSSYAMREENP